MTVPNPLDLHIRASALFPFRSWRLRDFIDPKYLLIQTDEQFDLARLVEPLEGYCCRGDTGPATHPEVLGKALPGGAICDRLSGCRPALELRKTLLSWLHSRF